MIAICNPAFLGGYTEKNRWDVIEYPIGYPPTPPDIKVRTCVRVNGKEQEQEQQQEHHHCIIIGIS